MPDAPTVCNLFISKDVNNTVTGITLAAGAVVAQVPDSSALVIGPDPYNGNIGTRHPCDNRVAPDGVTDPWAFDAFLAPNWTLQILEDNGATFTYSREYETLAALLACSGEVTTYLQPGTSTIVHTGTVYIALATDTAPGEDVQWEVPCVYQVYQGTGGLSTVIVQPSQEFLVPDVEFIDTRCEPVAGNGTSTLLLTIRTCVVSDYHVGLPAAAPEPLGITTTAITGADECDFGYSGLCCQRWDAGIPLTGDVLNIAFTWPVYELGATAENPETSGSPVYTTFTTQTTLDTQQAEVLMCTSVNGSSPESAPPSVELEPTSLVLLSHEADADAVVTGQAAAIDGTDFVDGDRVAAILVVTVPEPLWADTAPVLTLEQVAIGYWTATGSDIVLLYSQEQPLADPYYNVTDISAVVQDTGDLTLTVYICWTAHAVANSSITQEVEMYWTLAASTEPAVASGIPPVSFATSAVASTNRAAGAAGSGGRYHPAMAYQAGFVHRQLHRQAHRPRQPARYSALAPELAIEVVLHLDQHELRVRCREGTVWDTGLGTCTGEGRLTLPPSPAAAPGSTQPVIPPAASPPVEYQDALQRDNWDIPGDHLAIIVAVGGVVVSLLLILILAGFVYCMYVSCSAGARAPDDSQDAGPSGQPHTLIADDDLMARLFPDGGWRRSNQEVRNGQPAEVGTPVWRRTRRQRGLLTGQKDSQILRHR